MARQKVTISLEPELVQKIDEDRGLIPRSRYIEKLLKESLANTQNNSPTRYEPTQTLLSNHPNPLLADTSQTKPTQSSPSQTRPGQPRPPQASPSQPKPQVIYNE